MSNFQDQSYQRHAAALGAELTDPQRINVANAWFDPDNADSWRHARSYEIAGHLSEGTADRWVTVGDGRFGLDAINLRRNGAPYVLATDISEALLAESKKRGHLLEYSVENAERLSFADGFFDFVFCKEAYHHFPRPMIALYEMLRVARKGVILVEPNDRERSPLRLLKRMLGRGEPVDTYEEDGNYVYSISERELTKAALALNLPQVAFKGLNDAWEPGLWSEPAKRSSSAYRRMRRKIAVRDWLCGLGLDHHMLLMACLFQIPLDAGQRKRMERAGWRVVDLTRNPYLAPEPAG